MVTCPDCDGTGEVHSHNPKCPACRGTGLVSEEKAKAMEEFQKFLDKTVPNRGIPPY